MAKVNLTKENAELSFSEYCRDNKITPIKQDKLILGKSINSKNTRFLQATIESKTTEFSLLDDFESHSEFCNDGQMHLIKSLRQGKFKVVVTLDLHNYKQSEAMSMLTEFVDTAITGGDTCIKIIHGKGLNSPDNKSVLKRLVRRFLEHYPRLLAYAAAAQNNGGDGVTLVKLKSK